MDLLTDDDKRQLRLLANHLSNKQETIVERWRTKCTQDDAPPVFTFPSLKEFTNPMLALLHLLIQRIKGDSWPSDLGERVSQLHRWQDGNTLAEWVKAVDIFYDVLNEQFQQFLELYPQTQPRIISQVYSQLLHLSNQVNSNSISYADQMQQTRAEKQQQARQLSLDTQPQSPSQRVDHLQKAAHDLRSAFGILSTAASLLQRPLKTDDQVKYLDMLDRNVKVANHLLNQLLAHPPFEEAGKL